MRLKIASAILTVFGIISGIFLLAMLVWGFINRPLGTLVSLVGLGAVVAFGWALVVMAEEGEL